MRRMDRMGCSGTMGGRGRGYRGPRMGERSEVRKEVRSFDDNACVTEVRRHGHDIRHTSPPRF